ncbi:MAG TPA: alpha-2-macroglobulin family protein, partial [Thermoanaerobaculia bacterium]|nr:alpha-2-macroglobulin family protein [Thermoanaerobaculia bacterium]
RTDDNGEATLDLNLQRFAKATYRLRFIAQGFEAESGRGVSAESAILVCPMPYLIGFKADGDLHYVSKGSKRSIDLIAINPEAAKTAAGDLKMAWLERKYVSVLTKQSNGTYKYESVRKEIALRESPLAIPAAGLHYSVPTALPGDYALLVRDSHGTELNRIEYSVAGQANITRSLEKNAELKVALNKADYAPGEEIELQIKAPYSGAGLITIERERVFDYHWFKSETTSTVQKIRLPKDFEGNGYVSVSFIRDINSDEIFMSPLSYGVAPFSVSRDRRTARITVSSPDLAKPGEPYRIKYRTERPARIVLFAVDEGILQVARYANPDPLGYFFQKRALEVKTSQILDLILPEFKRLMALTSAPGGDGASAIGKNLNPFKRRRDKPVVFWSGIVDSGPDAREAVYQIPDYFNGSLRVIAVAVSRDAVGVFQKNAQIRGDFVINPNVPAFVAPDDDFEISVSVANNVPGSGPNAQLSLDLETSRHLEVVGARKVTVAAGEMREGTAIYRLRARPVLGSASLTFRSTMGTKSARFTTDLSVRPPLPYLTTLSAGYVRKGKEAVPVTRTMYPDFRTLQAGISHLPLGLAGGLMAYLEKVPYGCTEQLVSQGMPAVVMHDRPEFGYAHGVAEKPVTSVIATLQSRQNGDGAFGLWAANAHVSPFASVYATHFLLEAKERGFAVPRDMLDASMGSLSQLAASEGSSLHQERVRAYAIYTLTRNGVVTTNYATELQKRLEAKYKATWTTDLAGIYLAATYQMLKQERLASNLIAGSRLGDPQTANYDEYYDGLTRDAQLLYILARHFPDRLRKLGGNEINAIVDPLKAGHYDTLSSAYVILALDAYARSVGVQDTGKLSILETGRDGKSHELPLPAGLFPRVPVSDQAARVEFGSTGDFNAFYLLTQAGFDTTLPQKATADKLEVLREYTAAGGQPLQHVKLGDEIEVHLKLRTIGGGQYSNIAVTDLLPGGFEVVAERPQAPSSPQPDAEAQTQTQPAQEGEVESEPEGDAAATEAKWVPPIGSAGSTWQIQYADVREDRIVLYGYALPDVKEFIYKIKATNAGVYTVPPAFGESMYDRTILARSTGGKITVERK